ncbi:ketosteroid isomerase-like protein [Stackebrandtia albiflava]|uniref:Ketosteroid isomerase-like protein n=1 Tax=Stackebrandtia albiflava TaxID=406432 RepID=A0A562V2M4_9ACTN|nr:nuclear transport factor 2 family protein [Stackebrandtia albiflava]TWJ12105.1 ketosteroid isomerase-like protein [Stackebrandtia albiflava]
MDFSSAAAAHLIAVTGRDLPGLLKTVDPDVTVIMPDGTLLSGKDAVGEFHEEWFSDPDWSMEVTELSRRSDDHTGVLIYDVEYHDLDPDGEPYELSYLLTMVFRRTGDEWLLFHDQNTLR